MRVVDMGNSTANAARPNAPPPPPDAPARSLCQRFEGRFRVLLPVVANATSRALKRAALAARLIFPDQFFGSRAKPTSTGVPTRSDNFMAKDRFSSSDLARPKSRNSSGVNASFIFTLPRYFPSAADASRYL